MRNHFFKAATVCLTIVLFLPLGIGVRDGQTQPPPVGAPLVRQGAFALKLVEALNLGHPSSEVEAESMLGSAGISPRNGWIADYPVTPDIIGELRDSIGYAAQANTISTDKDTALKILEGVQADVSMSLTPGPAGPPYTPPSETSSEGYPDRTVINNYYYEQGPPIVTYYAPPPDYYYLYSWVPYPFWWGGIWFGGFFILHDFHRHYREDGHVHIVSNHFNDIRAHRVFRVDPVKRFNGRTFPGIGAPRANYFINTGVQRSPERIFNGGQRTVHPRSGASGTLSRPPTSNFRAVNPFPSNRVYSQPPGAGRTFTPRSSTPSRGRTSSAPSGGAGRGMRR